MQTSRRSLLIALGASAASTCIPSLSLAASKVRIGVIGAGSQGGTIGRLWVQAGHDVMFSSRNPSELASMAQALGPRASVGTASEAAAFGTILLLAVPYDALPQLGRDLAGEMRGKVVLDATNPPPDEANPLSREAYANGVGETSAKYVSGVRLVRAFSAVDATAVRASATSSNGRLGVPLASNDQDALQIAAQLIRDAGCEPVITGNLATARKFQRGGPGFRANVDAASLRRTLGLEPSA
ncbi:NADPH-dependent F420 reductase [Alcaligenaceae bacterium C4P045]|nr:NADPH-dependent F420 reductase [Alcaligenaceae bacterium C4P045]